MDVNLKIQNSEYEYSYEYEYSSPKYCKMACVNMIMP